MAEIYKIYTDGGCCATVSDPVGSWAYIVLKYNNETKEYDVLIKNSGSVHTTTNNKMEMEAVIQALSSMEFGSDDEIILNSDSKYVVLGSTEWAKKWQSNDWKTFLGKPVKNQDLWQKILAFEAKYPNLKFNWVKGHDTDKYNIECDSMCQTQIKNEVDKIMKDSTKTKSEEI